MNIPLITRQQLEIINRKTLRYPLHIAEKDYFLALSMQLISQSRLQNILVFKGGTALHHCYLEQSRFSEDLDFSTNQVRVTLDDFRSLIDHYDFLSIKKAYQSAATIKIESLQYTGPLLYPNSLKIEVDHQQNVLLAPQVLPYHQVWGLDFQVQVMDLREIAAEKIRAMSDRARYRDFYDLYLILETHNLDLDEVLTFISQKEIRIPIRKTQISHNWTVVVSQKAKEMSQIYYAREVADAQIENMITNLPFTEIFPPKATLQT